MTNEPMLGGPEPYQGQRTPAQPDAPYQPYQPSQQNPQYPGDYPPAPPQYPAYGGAPYPGYYAGPMPQSTNGMAIASLACSIASFVIAPFIGAVLGVIFGHMALKQLRASPEQGHGMAVAGLIIGYIHLALFVLVILFIMLVVIIGVMSSQPTN
ncbi:MAG TPA: DUF4190 domain-containing protein [Ktedonobacterales bacterium]